MKKTRKTKRTIGKYAMGSGNTGVIKGYMPDPSEVLRQNEINLDIAKAEAADNPFVKGLDMIGQLATQTGLNMLGGAMKKGKPNVDKVQKGINKDMDDGLMVLAKGSGVEGVQGKGEQVPVRVEKGELLETPDGVVTKEGGERHGKDGEGGNTKFVEEGTIVTSDNEDIKIAGKTMAERKEIRIARLSKISKSLETDPTDALAKETYKRTSEKNEYEEQADLQVQEFARMMAGESEKMFATGTGKEGVKSYSKGTDGKGVKSFGGKLLDGFKDFAGGFTPGDVMGIAGNIFQGNSALSQARNNAAGSTPNENQFANYGDDAMATLGEADAQIIGMQGQAEKKLDQERTGAINRVRKSSRSANVVNAMQLGIDAQANASMADIYSKFAQTTLNNIYKKAGLQTDIDQKKMTGAGVADIANRMDADNADTQLGVAKETYARSLQQTGKDLNQNKKSNVLANLTAQLSKYGLIAQDDGTITTKKV